MDYIPPAAIVNAIRDARQIAILCHERPDGDAIGSTVGLAEILNGLGKQATVYLPEPLSEKLNFIATAAVRLVPIVALERTPAAEELLIVLDTANVARLGGYRREHFAARSAINIDHHISNELHGDLNWVWGTASSTGEMIVLLAKHAGWPIPLSAARALYTAIVTDTGQFSFSCTSARVLRLAADLVDLGVSPEKIWEEIYLGRSLGELQLEARARSSLQLWANGKVGVISLSQKDFDMTGTTSAMTSEFPNIPRTLKGITLALFCYEVDEGRRTKVSFRSTNAFDACALAQRYGGGGHRQAAGCSLELPLDVSLQQLKREIERMFDCV